MKLSEFKNRIRQLCAVNEITRIFIMFNTEYDDEVYQYNLNVILLDENQNQICDKRKGLIIKFIEENVPNRMNESALYDFIADIDMKIKPIDKTILKLAKDTLSTNNFGIVNDNVFEDTSTGKTVIIIPKADTYTITENNIEYILHTKHV